MRAVLFNKFEKILYSFTENGCHYPRAMHHFEETTRTTKSVVDPGGTKQNTAIGKVSLKCRHSNDKNKIRDCFSNLDFFAHRLLSVAVGLWEIYWMLGTISCN